MSEYDEVLGALGSNSGLGKGLRRILDGELSMPNIPLKTMGGHVFWNTIASQGGYKLQQNMITQHARILDSEDRRIAWGTITGMTRALDRMVKYMRENKDSDSIGSSSGRLEAMQELKTLKELLDIGAITPEEFALKKAALMEKI